MKQKTVFVLAMVVAVLCCAGYSDAAILGTIGYDRAGRRLGEFSGIDIFLSYPLVTQSGYNTSAVSLFWDVTPADVGKTFFASAETHGIFGSFTDMLTNGIDELLFLSDPSTIKANLDLPGAEQESTLISGVHDGVDFEGYIIDSIALTINEFFLDYDADAIKGGLTSHSYDITYTINGSIVPEPCTLLLFGFGGFLLRRRGRW